MSKKNQSFFISNFFPKNHKASSTKNSFFPKNHKGISIMIGYVLLIASAIIMSVVVYQWMKTYVPKDSLECPDGVSIFIKDINFDCTSFQLNLTLQNNGRFNIAGYFIHATNDSNQELATIDLSQNIIVGAKTLGNAVKFLGIEENSFKPNSEPVANIFNLDNKIYSIEIIPVRLQTEDNKKRLVSCGNAKIKEIVVCEGVSGEPICNQEPEGICCNSLQLCEGGSFRLSSDCGGLCCVGGVCKLNATKFVKSLGAIAWWRFEGDATDEIGDNDGTNNGAVFVDEIFGKAADFSSSTGINIGNLGSPFLTNETSIAFWIKSNDVTSPARQNPFNQAYGGWGTMTLETTGSISWYFGSNGGNAHPYSGHGSGAGMITSNEWIQIIAVRNSSDHSYKWYKNGIYVHGGNYDSSYPVINTRTFTLGDGYVNPINGLLDEFMIFNKALSEEQVKALYGLDLS